MGVARLLQVARRARVQRDGRHQVPAQGWFLALVRVGLQQPARQPGRGGLIFNCRDVAERVRAEEELRRSEEQLARSNGELARSNTELEQFA